MFDLLELIMSHSKREETEILTGFSSLLMSPLMSVIIQNTPFKHQKCLQSCLWRQQRSDSLNLNPDHHTSDFSARSRVRNVRDVHFPDGQAYSDIVRPSFDQIKPCGVSAQRCIQGSGCPLQSRPLSTRFLSCFERGMLMKFQKENTNAPRHWR